MNQQFVLTVVTKDKPGIVQAVSEVVASHGGNWTDSSMVRLGGEFAGIVLVSLPGEHLDAMQSELAALASQGIAVTIQQAASEQAMQGLTAQLTLSGMDHPGIVRDISTALAESGVSIDEIQTELFAGSMTGQQMFSASAKIVIP
ncbi:MAG: ACT domain-containing protein, partial [Pseudomonadota bacterium]